MCISAGAHSTFVLVSDFPIGMRIEEWRLIVLMLGPLMVREVSNSIFILLFLCAEKLEEIVISPVSGKSLSTRISDYFDIFS